MKIRWNVSFAAVSAVLVPAMFSAALAQTLPGDTGRMMGGIFPANPPPMRPGMMQPQAKVPALPAKLALQAVLAIADGCKQYGLGVAVVDSKGVPRLVYIPDQSESGHAYTAIRKAYTAVTFKVPTSQLVKKAQTDADFAAKIHADSNLMAFKGGLPLVMNGQFVGAIGVSGAEPGGHDEECGLIGYNAIKAALQ